MAVFPKIKDTNQYRPNEIAVGADPAELEYWLSVFTHQIKSVAEHAVNSADGDSHAPQRAAEAARRFQRFLEDVRQDPQAFAPLTLMTFDAQRDQLMRDQGFFDTHLRVKHQENAQAFALLPGVLKEIDAIPLDDRLETLIRGVFAGNIFDLGVTATIELHKAGGMNFHQTRAALPPRPWRVDDFDLLSRHWHQSPPYRKAVVFVDNAGADVVLGMIPLARELARRGTQVILTANSLPSLNDITHSELVQLLQDIQRIDPVLQAALAQQRLLAIPSGCELPLLDLTRISTELARAATDADLLILEGMGRAIETNYHARFTCDVLRLAMIKDQGVAKLVQGKLYDVVCRFVPTEEGVGESN